MYIYIDAVTVTSAHSPHVLTCRDGLDTVSLATLAVNPDYDKQDDESIGSRGFCSIRLQLD